MKKTGIAFWTVALASLAVSTLGSAPATAAAGGMVKPALVGGINTMTNTGAGLGYRAGIDIAFWLGPTFDFTVGGEYLSRAFTGVSNPSFVQVPALFNLHMGPMFSIGAGGFYDFAITTGWTKNYGVTGDLRFKPVAMPLFIEGRYNHGLDTSDWGEGTKEFAVLLGFVF